MNKKITNQITGVAIITAILIALQVFANYVSFGPVSITLSLIPIAVGAILYGPNAGAFLGCVNGIIVCFAPSTLALFMPFNAFLTISLCILKTTLAGYTAGWIFKGLRRFDTTLAIVVSSVFVPIINTGLFSIGTMVFFMPVIESICDNANPYTFLFLTMIGFNFLIEFAINSALSPAIAYIVKIFAKTHNISSSFN